MRKPLFLSLFLALLLPTACTQWDAYDAQQYRAWRDQQRQTEFLANQRRQWDATRHRQR